MKKKDFYKNSLFIPSIYLGINYERQVYNGDNPFYAEEKLEWKRVVTLSLDIAVSPISQFRIAFPIQKTKEYGTAIKGTRVFSVLQYSLKLINLVD